MFTAEETDLDRLAAASIPSFAISIAHGSVTLQSAKVLVRPTAPGMFERQVAGPASVTVPALVDSLLAGMGSGP